MPVSVSILLVDDSVFFTNHFAELLVQQGNFQLTVVHTQREGLENLQKQSFDLIIWDIMMLDDRNIQMIQMHLIESTLLLLRASTVEALRWKTEDPALHPNIQIVPKPHSKQAMIQFAQRLSLLMKKRQKAKNKPTLQHDAKTNTDSRTEVHKSTPYPKEIQDANVSMMPSFIQEMLYQISSTSPYIIGIVASTGGPVALVELLKQLPVDYPIPIVIVQHISSKFTATFCDWLDMQISLPVQLVFDQMPIQKGVWLPAQERHVLVNKTKFVCEDSEPIQFSKPSGDVLLRSLADVFGTRAMGIVMTGMGQDGGAGLGYLKSKGGQAYVQSPDSCVIPGMVNACMRQCTVDGEMSPDALGVLLAGFIRKASC